MTSISALAAARGNPIWISEARARTRSTVTPVAATVFLGAVGVVAGVLFSLAAVGSPDHMAGGGQLARAAYHAVSFQLAVVVLVAPALGAAGISSERARGTLDPLLAGVLRPGSIVRAKLVGSVSYVLLFVFAALPLYVVAFLHARLGLGVLVVAELLTATAAVGGVSLGLFLSALVTRTSFAVLAACALTLTICLDVVLSGVVPVPGSGLPQTRSQLLAGASGVDTTALVTDGAGRPLPPRQEHIAPLRLVNPLYALHKAVNDPAPAVDPDGVPLARVARSVVPGDTSWSTWGIRLKPWQYSAAASLLASYLLLAAASSLVAGPGWRRRRTRQAVSALDTPRDAITEQVSA